ncbi:hypothetical protein RRG08_004576 [Elysia crispata]|uniref:Uncharacterized protein n=1 Tax=Elysia crispata TaxID=231223 RepID=A0AAE1AKH8_9GAST|nr:hypothetical protein RRG08_004576 [Elysia crispata]
MIQPGILASCAVAACLSLWGGVIIITLERHKYISSPLPDSSLIRNREASIINELKYTCLHHDDKVLPQSLIGSHFE